MQTSISSWSGLSSGMRSLKGLQGPSLVFHWNFSRNGKDCHDDPVSVFATVKSVTLDSPNSSDSSVSWPAPLEQYFLLNEIIGSVTVWHGSLPPDRATRIKTKYKIIAIFGNLVMPKNDPRDMVTCNRDLKAKGLKLMLPLHNWVNSKSHKS